MSRPLTAPERFELHRRMSALRPTVEGLLAAADRHVENARLSAEYRELASAAEREVAQAVRQRAAMDALTAERQALKIATQGVQADLRREREAAATADALSNTNNLALAALYLKGNR